MADCDENPNPEDIEIDDFHVSGCESDAAVDEAVRAKVRKQVGERRTKQCAGSCFDREEVCRFTITKLTAKMPSKTRPSMLEERVVTTVEITQHFYYDGDNGKTLYGGFVKDGKTYIGPLKAHSQCMCVKPTPS